MKRESGTKVHHGNIQASKVYKVFSFLCLVVASFSGLNHWFSLCLQVVADVIRTTLGPRSMLKMLLDAGGGTLLLLITVFFLIFSVDLIREED